MQHTRNPLAASVAMAFVASATLLSACGEFAYKRGAQSADLEQDRAACHATEKQGTSYEQCMAGRGWSLRNLDEEPLLASAGISTDNRAVAATDAPATAPAAGAETLAKPAAAQMATPAVASKPSTKSPVTPADPMERLRVGSWWKLGGNTADLEASIDACVATLGEAHRPDASKQIMTRGLVRCLREKGWYGVSNR